MTNRVYLPLLSIMLCPLANVCGQLNHPFSARIAAISTNESVTLENGSVVSSSDRLSTFGCGLQIDLFPSTFFSFVTGLEFQQRGVEESIPFYDSYYLRESSLSLRFTYLTLPLLLRFRDQINDLTPYGIGGFTVNCDMTGNGEPFALDASVGVGIRIEDSFRVPAFIEVRYAFDLTPAYDPSASFGIDNVKTNSVEIALGIAF